MECVNSGKCTNSTKLCWNPLCGVAPTQDSVYTTYSFHHHHWECVRTFGSCTLTVQNTLTGWNNSLNMEVLKYYTNIGTICLLENMSMSKHIVVALQLFLQGITTVEFANPSGSQVLAVVQLGIPSFWVMTLQWLVIGSWCFEATVSLLSGVKRSRKTTLLTKTDILNVNHFVIPTTSSYT